MQLEGHEAFCPIRAIYIGRAFFFRRKNMFLVWRGSYHLRCKHQCMWKRRPMGGGMPLDGWIGGAQFAEWFDHLQCPSDLRRRPPHQCTCCISSRKSELHLYNHLACRHLAGFYTQTIVTLKSALNCMKMLMIQLGSNSFIKETKLDNRGSFGAARILRASFHKQLSCIWVVAKNHLTWVFLLSLSFLMPKWCVDSDLNQGPAKCLWKSRSMANGLSFVAPLPWQLRCGVLQCRDQRFGHLARPKGPWIWANWQLNFISTSAKKKRPLKKTHDGDTGWW